jgi:hypothetical protein
MRGCGMTDMSAGLGIEEMRSCILEALRREPKTQEVNLMVRVARVASERGLLAGDPYSSADPQLPRRLWRRFRDVLWALIVEGIVAVGMDSANTAWPYLSVTEYGEACLKAGEVIPNDSDGYLRALAKVRPLDDVEQRFIPQALQAYLRNLPDASAVMLGCASEHLLQELADVMVALEPQRASKVEQERQKVPRLIKYLNGWLAERHLEPDLEEDRVHTFEGLAQLIRATRNEAGHPRGGRPVDRDRCYVLLRLFLEYRNWVWDVTANLTP